MARCDQGYLCDVCGAEVETLDDSDLYLRYVIGEVDPETLHNQKERHLRCNPTLAQFITAENFEPIVVSGYFDKKQLDPSFVVAEEARVTRGYLRLKELMTSHLTIAEYPLPEVCQHWREVKAQSDPSGFSAEASDLATKPIKNRPPSR